MNLQMKSARLFTQVYANREVDLIRNIAQVIHSLVESAACGNHEGNEASSVIQYSDAECIEGIYILILQFFLF